MDCASELEQIKKMAIRKKFLSNDAEGVDLQVFADASLNVMRIVSYFRNQQTREPAIC